MSLLKLLTTGQSLVGMRDTGSRYRMRSRNPMPKFGSTKNPFAQPTPKPEANDSAPASGNPAPAKMETGSLFNAEREKPAAPTVPAREIKVSVPRPSEPVKVEIKRVEDKSAPVPSSPKLVAKPRKWSGWLRKLNSLLLLVLVSGGHGRGMANRSRAAAGKHVQVEMSLDRIQVVRNDLRDADLEIVPGRLMGLPSGASPVLSNPARPETGGWSRMTSRIFGMEHTHI